MLRDWETVKQDVKKNQGSLGLQLQLNNMYLLDPVKMLENTVADENSVLIYPQDQAAKIRMEEAAKIRMEEERQKRVSVFVFILISVVV